MVVSTMSPSDRAMGAALRRSRPSEEVQNGHDQPSTSSRASDSTSNGPSPSEFRASPKVSAASPDPFDDSSPSKVSPGSPDPFFDSSPSNISRFGRPRKQKLIADFFVPRNGKRDNSSPDSPQIACVESPRVKRKYVKKMKTAPSNGDVGCVSSGEVSDESPRVKRKYVKKIKLQCNGDSACEISEEPPRVKRKYVKKIKGKIEEDPMFISSGEISEEPSGVEKIEESNEGDSMRISSGDISAELPRAKRKYVKKIKVTSEKGDISAEAPRTKRKYVRKSLTLNDHNGKGDATSTNSDDNTVSTTTSQGKIYVKKELIQRPEKKEATTNMMRCVFDTPIKTEPPDDYSSPPQSVDVIVLKKSPQGLFECSRKIASDFDSESFPNGDSLNGGVGNRSIKQEQPTEDEIQSAWELGELAWARVGASPMWPCLVTRDPLYGIYARKKLIGRSIVPTYALHVTFFGDKGRHAWLNVGLLMRFTGLDDFNDMKANFSPELRKKNPKYCASFEVKESKKVNWSTAVMEAEMLLHRPIDLREDLATMFFSAKNKSAPKKPRKEKKIKIKQEKPDVSLSESLFDSLFEKEIKKESLENDVLESAVSNGLHSAVSKKKKKKQPKMKNQTSMDRWVVKSQNSDVSSEDEQSCSEQTSNAVNESNDGNKNGSASTVGDLSNNVDHSVVKSENGDLSNIEREKKGKKSLALKKGKKVKPKEPNGEIGNEEEEPKRKKKRSSVFHKEVSNSEDVDSIKKPREDKEDTPENAKIDVPKTDEQEVDSKSETVPASKTENKYTNPQFLKWLEFNREFHRDMKPNLDEEEFLAYAHRIWLYNDENVLDGIECNGSPIHIKGEDLPPREPPSKRVKRAISNDISNSQNNVREKLTRKSRTNVSHYDCSSDSNDSDKESTSGIKIKTKETSDDTNCEAEISNKVEPIDDDVDVYMASLKVPKPNIYKGLPKEKVCELCEYPKDLVKCKGPCQAMYHVSCCEKQLKEKNALEKSKDVKKRRGRKKTKRENSTDSDDTSENSETVNGSHDSNLVIDDASEFESRLAQKMAEAIGAFSHLVAEEDEEGESSPLRCDDVPWGDVQPGTCVLLDFHRRARRSELNNTPANFKCNDCISSQPPPCCVCKSTKSPRTGEEERRRRCHFSRCHQYYHVECLAAWPQTKYADQAEIAECPRHVCHTCVSDDPKGCKSRFSGDKLAKCVRCPATYHALTKCTPAGTVLINGSHVICPKHSEDDANRARVNTSWCFICAKGGSLICCETCPTSFHAECLNIPLPEGSYICEECETGRLPLYEELVWVKLGQYRWWPAFILHPFDIPLNIIALPHEAGQFVVRFFGVYDHYWVYRSRVFPYQEGDTGHASSKRSAVDNAFLTAITQAQKACLIIKDCKQQESRDELKLNLLPPKFVKLKVNRPIGGALIIPKDTEPSKCDCKPDEEFPCSPDSDCLNRMLLTECSPSVCSAGSRCGNQYFEKRLYPPMQACHTSERGWGLKVLADVKKGDFIIEYVGEVIDEGEFQSRMRKKHEMRDENYYFLTLDKDRMIDAGPKGNLARFMNHSCEPNCETQKWTVNGDIRVGLFALKDIPAGTEVTFNYNLVCAGGDKKQCLCGTKRCAGYIGGKPKPDEQLPKKPKREYRKKKQKKGAKPGAPKKIKRKRVKAVTKHRDQDGIDRDVELINRSLLEFSAEGMDDSNDEKTPFEICAPEINYDEPVVIDEEEIISKQKLLLIKPLKEKKGKGKKNKKNKTASSKAKPITIRIKTKKVRKNTKSDHAAKKSKKPVNIDNLEPCSVVIETSI